MPSPGEQYGNTVQLFIGTGRSPYKITSRPFAFDNNSIVIYLGLNSLFLFKSVSSFLLSCRSSLAHSFGYAPSFVLFPCFFIPWTLVRRSLSTHYTPEALLNHVFEDLRKPKAPNNILWEFIIGSIISNLCTYIMQTSSIMHFYICFGLCWHQSPKGGDWKGIRLTPFS
jgi:hypothetical protein